MHTTHCQPVRFSSGYFRSLIHLCSGITRIRKVVAMLVRFSVVISLLMVLPESASALGWTGTDLNGVRCTGKGQGFGPWDFYDVDEPSDPDYYDGRWWEGKKVHADPGFAAMHDDPFDQGAYNRAAQEFDYLLRAYPNHPAILQGVVQLELKRLKSSRKLAGWRTPPECYLRRAQTFRPDQPHIYQLMGIYLQKLDHTEKAIQFYKRALAANPRSAEIHYNLGLAYFDIGEHLLAAVCGRQAYKLGYPLPGLQRKLERSGFSADSMSDEQQCDYEDSDSGW